MLVIAITRIPAASPAATPGLESSITQHSFGKTPSNSAARRKMSGAGLPRLISEPLTVALKNFLNPLNPSTSSTTIRSEPEARPRRYLPAKRLHQLKQAIE